MAPKAKPATYGKGSIGASAACDPEDFTQHSSTKVLFVSAVVWLAIFIVIGQTPGVMIAVAIIVTLLVSGIKKPTNEFTYRFTVGSESGQREPKTAYSTLKISGPPQGGSAIVQVYFPGTDPFQAHIFVDGERTIEFSTKTLRSGPREQFHARVMPLGGTSDWFGLWSELQLPHTLVLPPHSPLQRIPVSPMAKGLTGPRTTRRRGDGTEFRDLGLMAFGDSTRRIDWRASARNTSGAEQLYVRRTLAQSEATTIVMLDSRDEVGPEVSTWGGFSEIRADHRSSLDLAREAAVSLAHAAVSSGDRVGFEDLSRPKRPVLPGTGQRHLQRITHAIALTSPIGAPARRVRAPMVPAGSIVFFLSTFLDDSSAASIVALSARGHVVVAIDVLPTLSTWAMSDRQQSAFRLIQVHREARLRTVRKLGVPIIAWTSPDRDQLLARHAAAQRRHR